jgi:hypothetical protein
MRSLEVDLYISTFLSFGTEGGEQIYAKFALLLRRKIRYNLYVTHSRCEPADAKTLQSRLSRYPLSGYDTILTELYRLTLVLLDLNSIKSNILSSTDRHLSAFCF